MHSFCWNVGYQFLLWLSTRFLIWCIKSIRLKIKTLLSFFNWPRIWHFDFVTEVIKICCMYFRCKLFQILKFSKKSGKKWFWNVKLWLRTSKWYYKLGINMEYPFKISITFCHEGWRTIYSRTILLQFFISCCKEKLDLSNTYENSYDFFQITYRILDLIYQVSFFQCSLSKRKD